MKPIPLIRVSLFLPTIDFLDRLGTPIHRYLNQVNIPVLALDNPETLVPLPMAMRFLSLGAGQEGIENLGIVMAESARVSELGMLGQVICYSFTLYDALKRLCYFTSFAVSSFGDRFWLEEDRDCLWFCQEFPEHQKMETNVDHGIYYTLMLMLDVVRLALGDRWYPPEIHLPTKRYKQLEESTWLGKSRFSYERPYTAICIPKNLLSTPIHPLRSTLCQQRLQRWKTMAPASDFIGSLEQILSTLLLNGYPKITLAAEICGMSVRTLQRQLAEHHLTYSRLMDKVRYELAVCLLENLDIPMIEIAYALGFTDPGNFSHAFRRWTGVSPREFRKFQMNPRVLRNMA